MCMRKNKHIARQLEQLESHLKTHRNSRSFEVRKKIWDAVEECAINLDTLIDTPSAARVDPHDHPVPASNRFDLIPP